MRSLVGLFFTISWIVGIVISDGLLSTFLAFVVPLWALHLDAELLLDNEVY
jgi:hypothetical protein